MKFLYKVSTKICFAASRSLPILLLSTAFLISSFTISNTGASSRPSAGQATAFGNLKQKDLEQLMSCYNACRAAHPNNVGLFNSCVAQCEASYGGNTSSSARNADGEDLQEYNNDSYHDDDYDLNPRSN